MFRIQTCCNYILSAAEGFRGQEATCADPGMFVLFSPQLILQFTGGGAMVLLLRKTTLNLYQGSRGGPLFSRGGGSIFFQGGGSKC